VRRAVDSSKIPLFANQQYKRSWPLNFQKEEEEMRKSITWALVCLMLAMGLFACSTSPTTNNNGAKLTSIAVTPASPSIASGASQQFVATGTYSDNSTQVITGSVTWISSDTGKANISNAGLATAVAAGTPTITAMSGSIQGTATLTITQQNATLVSIAVTPANPSIATSATQQFTATGTYSDSTTQNLTGSVTWSSSNTSKATISTGGLASGVADGTSTITATSGRISGTATLTISALPVTTPVASMTVKGKENAIDVLSTNAKVETTVAKDTYTTKVSGHAYAYSTVNEMDGVILMYHSYDSNGISYNNENIKKLETGQTYTLNMQSTISAFFLDSGQTSDNSGQYTIDLYKSGSSSPDYTLTVKGKENAIDVLSTNAKVETTVAKDTYTIKVSDHAYAYSTVNEMDGIILMYHSYDSNGISYDNENIMKLETGQTYTVNMQSTISAFFLDSGQTSDNSGQYTIDISK
jgi:hypothetical protein